MASITYAPFLPRNSVPLLYLGEGQPQIAGIFVLPCNNVADAKQNDEKPKNPSRRFDRRIPHNGGSGSKNRYPSQSKKANACEEPSVVTPLYKTRLCSFHASGACRNGATCSFAHGSEDLRPSPDFEKTSVCPIMLNAGKCDRPQCRYAHNVEELRTSQGLLKTKMCSFFLNGLCVVGEACRFAHSAEELQEALCVQQATVASAATPKNKTNASLWELRRNNFRVPNPEQLESRKTRGASDSVLETEKARGPPKTFNNRVVVNVNVDDDGLPLIQSSSAGPLSASDGGSGAHNGPEDYENETNHTYNQNLNVVLRKAFIKANICDPEMYAEEWEGARLRSKSL